MCIAAALCFGLGGVLTGIAVSFYAATVVSDFYATGGMAGVGLSNMGGINAMQGKFYITFELHFNGLFYNGLLWKPKNEESFYRNFDIFLSFQNIFCVEIFIWQLIRLHSTIICTVLLKSLAFFRN